MKLKFLLVITVLLSGVVKNYAQESEYPYEDGFLQRYGVGIKLGTYGPGIDLHTSILPNLKARLGFNYLPYNYKDDISFEADDITETKTLEGDIKGADLKFTNANLLIDYYPVRKGIFCLTAGFYIGNNKVTANGLVNNYDGYSEFMFDDVIIKPNSDGTFDASLRLGNIIKPYLGIGLGRTISNSPVGFRFDLGVIYQGKYVIESKNIDENSIAKANEEAANFDLPFSNELLKLWPMLSFSISYRIK